MMKRLHFLSFLSLFIFTAVIMPACRAYALEDESEAPDAFWNKEEATACQCHMVNLKGGKLPSCVLQVFEGQELKLIIYDGHENGAFFKDRVLCIPSWYQKAKVKYSDLTKKGRQFIWVTFEGNTGTGVLQMILMIIGWHDGKYVPVLAETIDYYNSERGKFNKLKMNYKIDNIKTRKVSLRLKYKYREEYINRIPSRCNRSWTDVLKWNEKSFSFYNEREERSKIRNTPCQIQKDISNTRLRLHGIDADAICTDFFDKTKIMYVLD
jgi:hypothetical protein